MKKVTIIGAGLVGSLQAIYMAKRGFKVTIYERRSDMRSDNSTAGKSINLVVSQRGLNALKIAGIEDAIMKLTVPAYGRMGHDLEGNQSFHPYSINNEAIYSISRGALNAELMTLAESYDNVTIYFNQKCVDVDLDTATTIFEDYETKKIKEVKADLVIGSDGAFSAVRAKMLKLSRFNYSQQFIEHGYKELVIPPNADGTPKLDFKALHIWPRGEFMLMALANLDRGFTCTLFFPYQGKDSFESLKTENDLLAFFERVFPDAIPLMPTLVDDYFNNPTSPLAIIKCDPWFYKDKIALIGDAAHAIIPFYGEGMNCGFEDCFVFDQMLEKYGDLDMTKVLSEYGKNRKPNADAIADLSTQNFVEMRDLFANPKFILRKKIEGKMQKNHPTKWIPLYSQVKFTTISYSKAKKQGERHDKIMEQIMAKPNIKEIWNSPEIEKEILEQL